MKKKEVKHKETKGLSILNYLLEEKYIPSDILLLSYLYNVIKRKKSKKITYTLDSLSKSTGLSIKTLRNRLHKLSNNDLQIGKETISFKQYLKERLDESKSTIFMSNDILFNKDLTDKQKLILSYIVNFTSHNKECVSYNKTMIDFLNISESTLKSSLSKFKKLGLIENTLIDTGKGFIKKRQIKANMEAINNYYNCTINNDNRQYTMNQTVFNIGKVDNSKHITNNITVTLQIPEDATEEERLKYIREFMECFKNQQ